MNLSILKAIVSLLDGARCVDKGELNVADTHFMIATHHISDAVDAIEAGDTTGPQWEFLAGLYDTLKRLLDDEQHDPPRRVQLSRKKGWQMPANTVKVDRSTRWGNPVKPGNGTSRAQAVAEFRQMLEDLPADERLALLLPLRGKNLACWCKLDDECHADVLLEMANNEGSGQ